MIERERVKRCCQRKKIEIYIERDVAVPLWSMGGNVRDVHALMSKSNVSYIPGHSRTPVQYINKNELQVYIYIISKKGRLIYYYNKTRGSATRCTEV